MDDDEISTNQAAALAHVTRQTIERWVREKGLAARVIRRGDRKIYAILRSELIRFLREWYIDG